MNRLIGATLFSAVLSAASLSAVAHGHHGGFGRGMGHGKPKGRA